jgi:hypothetical protein
MTAVPKKSHTTANAILEWYEAKTDEPRLHLGCSEIGGPCDRQLWYNFRWASTPEIKGRIRRLFQTGHLAEDRFLADLRAIGVEVLERDPDTGKQFYFSTLGNHFGGSCDGIGRGFPEAPKAWAITEFKTHSSKSFNSLMKDGVLVSKPQHWAQMQCYMLFAELDRALYLAVNKDNDDLYSEWVHFDEVAATTYVERAERVINATKPLTPVSTDFTWYQCKMCNHYGVCHSNQVAQKNCRTCVHATPDLAGQGWICEKFSKVLSFKNQKDACGSHLFIPDLVPYADVVDGSDDWVGYKHKTNGTMFANITKDCTREMVPEDFTAGYLSEELVICTSSTVADQLVENIKSLWWGAKVIPYEVKDDPA